MGTLTGDETGEIAPVGDARDVATRGASDARGEVDVRGAVDARGDAAADARPRTRSSRTLPTPALSTPTLSTRLLEGLRLLLVALWLGGAAFFSFAVAPAAFAVLPTHELAGAVVTRTIAVVNVGGFVVGLLVAATAFIRRGDVARRAARVVEVASSLVVAAACGVGHWVVAARMVALRASMGRPIDRVPIDDPARVAFNSLHGYSVALMCAAMLAGAVALFAVARGREGR